MSRDGEIVGLHSSNNGRSCTIHDCCGDHLALGDLIRFKLDIVSIEGIVEKAIRAIRIVDDTELCTIGFLPRNIVRTSKDKYIGKFAQIIELYDYSDMEAKRRKSHRNLDIASFRLLENIPDDF